MLIQYSVENYKSIRDEAVISFAANETITAHSHSVTEVGNPPVPLLKLVALIGPNASGKSNILDSLRFCFRLIGGDALEEDSAAVPFLLDNGSRDKPSRFEFIYLWKDTRYIYGFSVCGGAVTEEYLMGGKEGQPAYLFERGNPDSYTWLGTPALLDIEEAAGNARLCLPLGAKRNPDIAEAYEWFEATGNFSLTYPTPQEVEECLRDKEKHAALLRLVRAADFNIADIKLVGAEGSPVIIDREGSDDEGRHLFSIDFGKDSAGTREFILDAVAFLRVCERGGMVGVDEFGTSLHQKLHPHLLKFFLKESDRTGRGQMILTTHNTGILRSLRSDQVYLIDREEPSGATIARCFDDFELDKDENLEQSYLKGRFGAVPYPKEDLPW